MRPKNFEDSKKGFLVTKISKEEVLKIAHISSLDLHDDEIPALVKQLQDVLTYAERVTQVAADTQEPSVKKVNVFREDVVIKSDPEEILSCAPEREQDYFVVPAVLESSKK